MDGLNVILEHHLTYGMSLFSLWELNRDGYINVPVK